MLPIGNIFDDADSVILFPYDIKGKSTEKLKFTWDIGHYFNVVKTMDYVQKNEEFRNIEISEENYHRRKCIF